MCVTERGGGKGADTYQVHIGQGSLRTTFRPSDQHLNATNPFNPCGSIEKEHPLGQLGKLSSGTRSAVSSLAGALFPAHRLSNKAVSIPGHFGGGGEDAEDGGNGRGSISNSAGSSQAAPPPS